MYLSRSLLLLGALSVAGVVGVLGVSASRAQAPGSHLQAGIVDSAGNFHTYARAWRIARKGWVPEFEVLVYFPDIASEDALIAQLRVGKKKIGKAWGCPAAKMLSTYQENPTTPEYPAHLAHFKCRFPDTYAQKKKGDYEIDLGLRQTLQEKSTPWARFS